MNLRIKNFLSSCERKVLSTWILDNYEQPFFVDANMSGVRKTTRYSTDKNFDYPKEAKLIREKIVKIFNLDQEENLKIVPPFKDGIVASIAFPGDTCYAHFDPIWHDGYNTLHCNVIVQAPESGGLLVLDGKQYEMEEGELFCYLVSKYKHETTKVCGKNFRLMFIFGFCITDSKWNEILKKH